MNERIRELYAQAGLTMNNLLVYEQWYLDSLEKFAELIVKECCDQLVKEGDAWEQFSRNPPQGQAHNASAALFAAYRLKEDAVSRLEEHFGVE
jgi:hypothetical protein